MSISKEVKKSNKKGKKQENRRRKKKINNGKLIILLSFILMFVIATGIVLSSSIFEVNNIIVKGNKEIKKDEVVKIIESYNNKNIFRYNMRDIKSKINKNPYVEDISIKRKFPNALEVSIKEKVNMAILSNGNEYSYVDKNGKLLKSVLEIDSNEKVVLANIDYTIDENNNIKFKSNKFKDILFKTLESLKSKDIYDRISTISFEDNNIKLVTVNNIKVLLHTQDNIEYKIAFLHKVLVDLQNKDINSGTIDMTLSDNKVTYKAD